MPGRFGKAHRVAPAIVKDMCGLVDDEILEPAMLPEVVDQHVACRLLTESDQTLRLGTEQAGANADEVQVRQILRGMHPRGLAQHGRDVLRREHDHRPFKGLEHWVVFGFGEQMRGVGSTRRRVSPIKVS
jgi:hypothetical protein